MKINYVPFNKGLTDHKDFLFKIKDENPNYSFLNGDNNLFIAQGEYNMIGILAISKRPYKKESISMDIAISKEEQKKGYGTYILENMSDYLIENNLCQTVILEISFLNLNSVKAALKAGFQKDDEVLEAFRKEDYRYIPYSKKTLTKRK